MRFLLFLLLSQSNPNGMIAVESGKIVVLPYTQGVSAASIGNGLAVKLANGNYLPVVSLQNGIPQAVVPGNKSIYAYSVVNGVAQWVQLTSSGNSFIINAH